MQSRSGTTRAASMASVGRRAHLGKGPPGGLASLLLLKRANWLFKGMSIGRRDQSPADTTRTTPIGLEAIRFQSRARCGGGLLEVASSEFDEEDRSSGAPSEAPVLLQKSDSLFQC